MNKICPKCNKVKDYKEFYPSPNRKNGVRVYCKLCEKVIRVGLRTYMRDYMRKTRCSPEAREKSRIWSQKYRERIGVVKDKERQKSYREKYEKKYPEKIIAKWKVKNAIHWNKLEKEPCFVCGELKVQAHHPDYSKPLKVIWLCKKHHGEIHRK